MVAALLSPISPLVLVCVPLAVLLLAYRARRFSAVVLAVVLLGLVFSSALSDDLTPLWFAERAWALLLAGGFVATGLAMGRSRTLTRSIVAVGLAFSTVALAAIARPELLHEMDWWVTSQIERAALVAHQWFGSGAAGAAAVEAAVESVVQLQTLLYPALLALASVSALGVACYGVARMEGADVLGPVREFRFSDQLIWLLVAGLLLFLLPAGEVAARLGENAMAFMGGLYLLRGVAIILWLGAALVTSAWSAALWSLVAVLLYPIVVGAALVMGLSDTWLDLRRRFGRSEGEPE